MNEDKKPVQQSEVSLKYMAWDIKIISKQLEKIAELVERAITSKNQPELF